MRDWLLLSTVIAFYLCGFVSWKFVVEHLVVMAQSARIELPACFAFHLATTDVVLTADGALVVVFLVNLLVQRQVEPVFFVLVLMILKF